MSADPNTLSRDFLAVLSQVLGQPRQLMALHEPEFKGNEWAYVKECIDTGWVSSVGKYVDEFELRLAALTGSRHAIAVVNGTAALHIAMQTVGVQPGDEVIVPALSFVGTANAVAHAGATPHFVDNHPETLGLDPDVLDNYLVTVAERTAHGVRHVRTGRRIAAVVPMHTFGHPVQIERLVEVAAQWGLPIVEDAAESLGSTSRGRHTGTFGRVGVLSFNGNKIVTTGGGGAILTDDPALAKSLKHLTTTAKRPHRWEFFHDAVAYNYRLPNLNAALGCAQLELLPEFLASKRALAAKYRRALAGAIGMSFADQPAQTESNFWLNAVRLATPDMAVRDTLLGAANDAGYQCRPAWTLLNKLPMYEACPRADLPVAQALEASLINLPSSPKLNVPTP